MRTGSFVFWITFFLLVAQSPFVFRSSEDYLGIPLVLVIGFVVPIVLRRISHSDDVNFQIEIFLLAFSLRIWVSLLLYGYGLSELFGDEDASGYAMGWMRAQEWYITGLDGFLNHIGEVFATKQNVGQTIIWGIISFIAGGPARIPISFFHCFIGAALVIVVYRLAKIYLTKELATTAAYFATFWLSLLMFSAGTSKEILVIFLEWTLILIAVRNPKGISIRDLFFALPLILLLYTMRFYAFYAVAAAFALRAIVSRREHFLRNGFAGLLLASVLFFTLHSLGIITRDQEMYETRFEQTNLENWRKGVAASTESGIVISEEIEGTWLSIPVKAAYYFFSPFPWEIGQGSLRRQIAILETIFLIVVFVAGFAAIKNLFKDRLFELLPPLAFSAIYSGVHIAMLSNVGLAWRHRQTVMPLIFLFVAGGFAMIRQQRGVSRLKRRRRKQSPITALNLEGRL